KPNVTGLSPHNPKSVIFIGNSFFYSNNGMPHHLGLLEKAADPEHKQDYHNTMVTIGGAALDWHDVESYFRPDGIDKSSVDDMGVCRQAGDDCTACGSLYSCRQRQQRARDTGRTCVCPRAGATA